MGPGEVNGFMTNPGHSGPADLTKAVPPGVLPAIPSGESNDGPGWSWESAWIDLGGEG